MSIQFHVRPMKADHTLASLDTVEEAEQWILDRRISVTVDGVTTLQVNHRLIRHVVSEYEVQVAA